MELKGRDIANVNSLGKKIYGGFIMKDGKETKVPNKLAGEPYWRFLYDGKVFTANNKDFYKDLKKGKVASITLIEEGEYINYVSHENIDRIVNQAITEEKVTLMEAGLLDNIQALGALDVYALARASS